MSKATVRAARPEESAAVLELMQALAAFEGYLEQFAVTAEAIENVVQSASQTGILVAETEGKLIGLLVYFYQPFTYDLTRWMVIKEFYVDGDYRGQQVGKKLFEQAKEICRQAGGSKIKWEVLAENASAKHFYQSMGAELETHWQIMSLKVD